MKVRELVMLLGQCYENDEIYLDEESDEDYPHQPLARLYVDRGRVILTSYAD